MSDNTTLTHILPHLRDILTPHGPRVAVTFQKGGRLYQVVGADHHNYTLRRMDEVREGEEVLLIRSRDLFSQLQQKRQNK